MRGCQENGITWMPRLFMMATSAVNKETRERQDPEIHDKRFSHDEIKGDFLQHHWVTTMDPCI